MPEVEIIRGCIQIEFMHRGKLFSGLSSSSLNYWSSSIGDSDSLMQLEWRRGRNESVDKCPGSCVGWLPVDLQVTLPTHSMEHFDGFI